MSNSAVQRRKEILNLLHSERICNITDLSNRLQVSSATLRRDVTLLEEEGLLRRSHGSIHLTNPSPCPSFDERRALFSAEKERICHAAVSFLHDDDTVLIDGGSTTLGVLPYLKSFHNLILVTNSISCALEVPPDIANFVMLGGQLDQYNLNIYGPFAEEMLDEISASILFLSTTGICGTEGLTTHSPHQASIKRKMISRSKKKILLVDSHKFVQSGSFRFATFSDIDVLITSNPITDDSLRQHLDMLGVQVIVAE